MTTSITRPAVTQRLRLISPLVARATGIAEAKRLLAETFPADEDRTPADALYTALIEFVALANDNRFEEMNERLKGFCEVVGPVLYRPEHQASKRLTMRESNAAYGAGCSNGHKAAEAWLSNPQRGNPKHGGTLQNVVLELAERMRNAQGEQEIERARGEIVGFCYRVECPADSIACAEIMDKQRQQGAKQ